MEKYCSLFGHSEYYKESDYELRLKKEIEICVKNNICNFYIGGYGHFDSCCARIIKEMKLKYPQIKSFLVLAYLNKKLDEYDKKLIANTYDGTIYPPIENVPLKFAILARNKWIVESSNHIIFFINHTWGGAYKAYEYAKNRKIHFTNIGKATLL